MCAALPRHLMTARTARSKYAVVGVTLILPEAASSKFISTFPGPRRAVKRKKSLNKKVDLKPVLVIFLIAIFVLGLGPAVMPIAYVFGAFVVILIVAFVVLARSMMR